jgi:hypothetical protein
MSYEQAIRELNDAAYSAAKAAGREGFASEATRLRSIALDADRLVDEYVASVRRSAPVRQGAAE